MGNVETADQRAAARALDCALGQGCYLARLLPPAEARARVVGGVPLLPSPSAPSP